MKKLALLPFLLIGFVAHAQFQCQWNLFCVTEVGYDSLPNRLLVAVYNGNSDTANMINYPTVQVVSPQGDTVGNPAGTFEYFGQMAGTVQYYSIPVTQSGISNFSNYTFLLTDQVWDTTGVIEKCFVNSLVQPVAPKLKLYPTLVNTTLYIEGVMDVVCEVYNVEGSMLMQAKPSDGVLDVSGLAAGWYSLVIEKNSPQVLRFFKQ